MPLRVEGEHLIGKLQGTLNFNTRHAFQPRVDFSKAGVFDSQAWDRAGTVCEKLGDFHSRAFWYGQFKTAIGAGSDMHLWATVSQALEMYKLRQIKKATVAGYAVGILKRSSKMVA